MPSKHRLSHAELVRLSKMRVARTHGAHFSLTSVLFPEGGRPKFACVVSKKIALRAVDRNRIQRRCRELVRNQISALHEPYALVLYAKRGASTLSFEETRKDVVALLVRSGVFASGGRQDTISGIQ